MGFVARAAADCFCFVVRGFAAELVTMEGGDAFGVGVGLASATAVTVAGFNERSGGAFAAISKAAAISSGV